MSVKPFPSVRVASLDAYERWKATSRRYERLLETFDDDRRLSQVIARGRHLNLCVRISVVSARVEESRDGLVALLDGIEATDGPTQRNSDGS